jgi:molybdopterin converting factor small subunit
MAGAALGLSALPRAARKGRAPRRQSEVQRVPAATIQGTTVGATVADLLAAICIPIDGEIITGLNGEQAQRGTVLHDGDDLVFFSPMEGG